MTQATRKITIRTATRIARDVLAKDNRSNAVEKY